MSNPLFVLLSPFKMNLGEAAVLALMGLLIVFVVLAVLVGILTVFKLVFNIKLPSKKSASEVENNQEAAFDNSAEDNDELIAVISAAIACMDDEEIVKAPFVIKSITELK